VNRNDFQELALVRLAEARSLLNSQLFDGAYYLAGYVVECALKACIARQTRQYDFPDRRTVDASYTHDLVRLMRVAGLEPSLDRESDADPDFRLNWSAASTWSEESRYARWTADEAEVLYRAVSDDQHGVLRWLRRHW
jgi:hypothetical protein